MRKTLLFTPRRVQGRADLKLEPPFNRVWPLYAENLIFACVFLLFYVNKIGFKNSGLTLELGVLVGIGRSETLRGIIPS